MDWDALENNNDVGKFGHFPYEDLKEVIQMGQKDTANHVIGKVFDLLLAKGWLPSEILESVSDVAAQKFNYGGVVGCLDDAATELFNTEQEKQSAIPTESNDQ
jgi:hypothetical protein